MCSLSRGVSPSADGDQKIFFAKKKFSGLQKKRVRFASGGQPPPRAGGIKALELLPSPSRVNKQGYSLAVPLPLTARPQLHI